MKTSITTLAILLTISTVGCASQPSKSAEAGVVINGVEWATCNVDSPGTFAANPEDAGMFYQWNSKKGWCATGDFPSNYYKPSYTEWEKANDPSPSGWRLPTIKELECLWDTTMVTQEWTQRNGVQGLAFTDKATSSSIFLPAVGYRDVNGGSSSVFWEGTAGFYWSSTPRENNGEKDGFQYLDFGDRAGSAGHSQGYGINMFSMRCVVE